ncbi:staygreen family protein [Gottschalkia acidurici]|uniref:staygreen family protein n=1 Tax=Clostridium acidurici TaxID=1556 RepID=UPI0002FEE901|nr:staygreen family protein [Gottschalkia acidurici]
MNRLDPSKLSVEFRNCITYTKPVLDRYYTLTHSDITGELFLTIDYYYAYDKITSMRDEVFGQWTKVNDRYFLNIYLCIDGEGNIETIPIRDMIFRRELPLALEAIRYGDKEFFYKYPLLDSSNIIVYFISNIPYYNKIEHWGKPLDYKYSE